MQSTRQFTCRAGFLAACPIERLEARRLLSFGDLEPLFGGGDAIQTTDFGATDTGRAVVVQPDGKILVAGSWDGGASEFALARYNPDGSLDSTFGGGFFGAGSGKTNAGFTGGLSGAEFATDMALQSDGKIVLVGYTNLNGAAVGGNDFAIARFTSTGALDATFSGDGLFTVDFGVDDRATGVAIRSDGKIVVGGFDDGGSSNFAIIRLTTAGALDTTFNTTGKFEFTYGAADFCDDIALQSDNKIVMVGYTNIVAPNDMAVARVLADGGLDTTFDTDGKTTIDFGGDDRAHGVVVDSGGRIVLAGAWDGGSSDFATVRLTTTGALDTSYNDIASPTLFQGDGKLSFNLGGAEFAQDITTRGDGKYVVAGFSSGGGGTADNFAVARINVNGTLDSTFDNDGFRLIDLGADDEAYGVANWIDGSIIVAGATATNFAILRLRGALDLSFSSDGRQETNFGATDTGRAVLVQPDGKILVAGSWDGGDSEFALARYNADGTLDNTFGGGFFGLGSGKTNASFTGALSGAEFAMDLALQADGKIVLVGYTNLNGAAVGGNDWGIARFTSTGALDPTFSGDGLLTVNFGFDDRATGVAIRPNGKIVVGGFLDGGGSDFGCVQINSNGTLDTSFGNVGSFGFPGATTVNFLGASAEFANDVALQSDGKVVLAGYTTANASAGNGDDLAVVRLNANGTLDTTFDADGINTANPSGALDRGNAVAIDSAGFIVIAGQAFDFSSDFLVARFRATGAFDSVFTTTVAFGFDDVATSITVQPDGKFLVGGYTDQAGLNDFAVTRILSGGGVDTTFEAFGTHSFANGGEIVIDMIGNDLAYGIAVQPDGHIVLAGTSDGDFAVARLMPRFLAFSAVFEFETIQQVLVQFSSAFVGLTTSDFTLDNLTTLTTIPTAQITLTNLGNGLARLRFPGASNHGVAGALPDGNYRLTLPANTATDVAGNPNATAFTFNFFFLMGDANRDKSVDTIDFNNLAANFGQVGKTFSQGNFNYDGAGSVDTIDFNLLVSNFSQTLPGSVSDAVAQTASAPASAALFSEERFDHQTEPLSDILG